MNRRSIKNFFFENTSLRQTIVKNTIWLTASNFAGRIIRAALIIYVARVLGTEGYGIFSYAVGLAAFFSVFSDIGVNGILTREGARNPKALPEYLGTSLGIKIVLLFLTDVIVIIATPHLSNVPGALPLLPWAALLITFDGLRDLTFSITRAGENMQTEAGINIVTNLAITIIGIVVVFSRATPLMLMIGYTFGSACGTIAAYWLLREHFRAPWKYFRFALVKPILVEGFPFALMGLLGTIMLNTDTVMVGWLTNATDAARSLGLYAAAQRPIQILYIMPGILSTVLFPAFSRFASKSADQFRSIFERAMAFCFFVAVPIVIGGVALGQNIILLLFGKEYLAAAPSFTVLLFTILITFPGVFIGNAIFAHGEREE